MCNCYYLFTLLLRQLEGVIYILYKHFNFGQLTLHNYNFYLVGFHTQKGIIHIYGIQGRELWPPGPLFPKYLYVYEPHKTGKSCEMSVQSTPLLLKCGVRIVKWMGG